MSCYQASRVAPWPVGIGIVRFVASACAIRSFSARMELVP